MRMRPSLMALATGLFALSGCPEGGEPASPTIPILVNTPTVTQAPAATATQTDVASPTIGPTHMPTSSAAPTPSVEPSPAVSSSPEPTAAPTPSAAVSPSAPSTATPSAAPTATAAPTPSPSATAAPTAQPTAPPTPMATTAPTPSPTATQAPTATAPPPTPTATATAAPTPTATATAQPTPTATPTPTPTRAPTPTAPTDADGDGYTANVDCDDSDAAVHPDAEERCNGADDDCDTAVDEAPEPPEAQGATMNLGGGEPARIVEGLGWAPLDLAGIPALLEATGENDLAGVDRIEVSFLGYEPAFLDGALASATVMDADAASVAALVSIPPILSVPCLADPFGGSPLDPQVHEIWATARLFAGDVLVAEAPFTVVGQPELFVDAVATISATGDAADYGPGPYSHIDISGALLGLGDEPITLTSHGSAIVTGALDVSGEYWSAGPGGFDGGRNGSGDGVPGAGPGAGGGGGYDSGGGGAGHGNLGGPGGQSGFGGAPGAGGAPYGSADLTSLVGGSGGGSGGEHGGCCATGGGGGGALSLQAQGAVIIGAGGAIRADGGKAAGGTNNDDYPDTNIGRFGGAGGGSGGAIKLKARWLMTDGVLSAAGSGGSGGGDGPGHGGSGGASLQAGQDGCCGGGGGGGGGGVDGPAGLASENSAGSNGGSGDGGPGQLGNGGGGGGGDDGNGGTTDDGDAASTTQGGTGGHSVGSSSGGGGGAGAGRIRADVGGMTGDLTPQWPPVGFYGARLDPQLPPISSGGITLTIMGAPGSTVSVHIDGVESGQLTFPEGFGSALVPMTDTFAAAPGFHSVELIIPAGGYNGAIPAEAITTERAQWLVR